MPITPDERRARARMYYQRRREQRADSARSYYQQNKDQINERRRLHHQQHREEQRKTARSYYQLNKKKILAKRKEPEERAKQREYQRKRYHKDLGKSRRDNEWQALQKRVAKAGRQPPDRCEICGRADRRIEFDHCHQRNVFRGWICVPCNRVLGIVQDDPNRLRQLIAYLERTKDLISPQLSLPGV